jgi:hypothetical protein
MDAELWKQLYRMVMEITNNQRPPKATYSDAEIVLTFFWAVLHDRPVYWACQKRNWPIWHRRRSLPNNSTMSRRLRTSSVKELLEWVEQELIALRPAMPYRWIDGKPLPIGGNSQDRDAGFGRAAGGNAKGYKLHAVADSSQGIVAWTIRPMNENEKKPAKELIPQLSPGGYLVGDNAYDSNRLYDLAGERSIQLLSPRRRNTQLGHKRHSVYRLRAANLLQTSFGERLLHQRADIERMFGQLTNIGFGLKPLPNWVRGLHRVTQWVQAKMILYHFWRNKIQGTAA